MGKTVVEVKNVSKKFNIYRKNIQKIMGVMFGKEPSEVLQALDSVSFKVEQGERVGILGKVESGRTTLANIISGVSFQSKGSVSVDGEMNVMLNAKAGIDVEFTTRENIYLKANVVGLTKKEIEPYEDDILKFTEAEDFADLPLKRAHKGAPALLSLAVHLVKDADILLIDDVFNGGGDITKGKCEQRVVQYMNENPDKTLIIVSNRLAFIEQLCTRTIVLKEGKVVHDGDVAEGCQLFREIFQNKR